MAFQRASPSEEPTALRFRILVSRVAQRLNDTNRESLVYIYELPEKYKKATNLEVLTFLETLGEFSPWDQNGLVEVLRNMDRHDLEKEVEKQIKKDAKAAKSKGKGGDDKQNLRLLTPKEALLKAKFDQILLQATLLVEHVDKLRITLAEEEHRENAEEILGKCADKAGDLERTLRTARSAARLSERVLGELGAALQNVHTITGHTGNAELSAVAGGSALQPTQEGSKGNKKKPMPLPSQKKPKQATAGVAQTADLLEGKLHLHLGRTQSAPSTPKGSRKFAANGATSMLIPLKGSRIPVLTSFPVPNKPQSSESTGDNTEDSGFEEPGALLKRPLPMKDDPHVYASLQEETMNQNQDMGHVYDTAEQQEPLYENVPHGSR